MEYIFQSDNIKERPISMFVFFLPIFILDFLFAKVIEICQNKPQTHHFLYFCTPFVKHGVWLT